MPHELITFGEWVWNTIAFYFSQYIHRYLKPAPPGPFTASRSEHNMKVSFTPAKFNDRVVAVELHYSFPGEAEQVLVFADETPQVVSVDRPLTLAFYGVAVADNGKKSDASVIQTFEVVDSFKPAVPGDFTVAQID